MVKYDKFRTNIDEELEGLGAIEYELVVSTEVGDDYHTEEGGVLSVMVVGPEQLPVSMREELGKLRALEYLGELEGDIDTIEDALTYSKINSKIGIEDINISEESEYAKRVSEDDMLERFTADDLEVINMGVLVYE
jgi:hypothetical protein